MPSDNDDKWNSLREKIIGLGESSIQKSYYPELQKRVAELQKFRSLLDQSNDAIFLLKFPSGKIDDANESACNQLGYTYDELTNLSINDLLATNESLDYKMFEDILLEFDDNKNLKKTFDAILKNSDKREIPFEISVSLVDFSGYYYVVVVARDITERIKSEQSLRESENFLQTIYKGIDLGVYVVNVTDDGDFRFEDLNPACRFIKDFELIDIKNKTPEELMPAISLEKAAEMRANFEECLKSELSIQIEEQNKIGDNFQWFLTTLTPLKDGQGRVNRIIGTSMNIDKLKKAEIQIKEHADNINILNKIIISSNKAKDLPSLLEDILDHVTNLMNFESAVIYMLDDYKEYSNIQFSKGMPTEFIESIKKINIKQSHDKNGVKSGKSVFIDNYQEISKKEGFLSLAKIPLISKDQIIGSICVASKQRHYFTEEEKKLLESIANESGTAIARLLSEIEVIKSLNEKEVLLKEIHHRVKNNLQIISSLLNLQSNFINDQEYLAVFRESQNRIKSMALIHEQLYQSRDLTHINFEKYMNDIVNHLIHAYATDLRRINIKKNIENVSMGIETAIPCGLIINEIVSNALKHAFPDKQSGEVKIEFESVNNEYNLTISDDGIGLPEDFDIERSKSLGLKLVNMLITQIDGKLEINKDRKTEFKIKFNELEYKERI
ncbi:MAG: histidine kinase dimerization/phosphoacceptor domain -containing protein [Methanobacteriaceae archaeon]|nr:histidine kinase dimerization/phosphoacceptor domain -containing protein [Methanobacteriaceae archaeon]